MRQRGPRLTALIGAVTALVLSAGPAPAGAGASAAAPVPITPFLTTVDRTHLLARGPALRPTRVRRGDWVIQVDPTRRFQSMIGFGAALTDASAELISECLTPAARDGLMAELFGPEGERLGALRLTIGASDFSTTRYSLDDMAPGQTDPQLAHFSLAPELAEVVPLVRQARALDPDLWVMASPWSAPGWMKTTDSLVGGQLATGQSDAFARYLVAYLKGMGAAGAPVDALTIQNEPGFEPADYPGMRVPPEVRARLIGRALAPAIRAAGLSTLILDHDHNWDTPQSPLSVLDDPVAAQAVGGVAWHCYAGDVAAQSLVHAARPAKDTFFTECSGGDWAPEFGRTLDWFVRTLIIEAPRHWARTVLLWNLALDETHGPHLGGCGDCRGVVTIDRRTGAITRNLEYYALGHASRFVRRGAVRIASTGDPGGHDVDTVAFENPDRSRVLIAVNGSGRPRNLAVRLAGRVWRYALPAGAVVSLVWSSGPSGATVDARSPPFRESLHAP